MIMKSKELKIYNLPGDNTPLSEINAKPTGILVSLMIIGCFLAVLKISIVYGLMMIVVGFICVCFMPRVTLMEFYYDYFVMYNRADRNTCVLIYYKEVVSWCYLWNAKKDTLVVELEDGSIEKIEGFSKTIFEAYMYRYLKDKHKKSK